MNEYFLIEIEAEADIGGGPGYGSKYSLENACMVCGTGAELAGPLIAKRPPKRKGIFHTFDFEVVISDEFIEILQREGLNCFKEIHGYKTNIQFPYKVLIAEKVLPPFHKKSKGFERENPCKSCKRDGYFNIPHKPLELKYSEKDEFKGYDVLATFERFGVSALREPLCDSRFASPRYIVSERIMQVFKRFSLGYLEFTPITFL